MRERKFQNHLRSTQIKSEYFLNVIIKVRKKRREVYSLCKAYVPQIAKRTLFYFTKSKQVIKIQSILLIAHFKVEFILFL